MLERFINLQQANNTVRICLQCPVVPSPAPHSHCTALTNPDFLSEMSILYVIFFFISALHALCIKSNVSVEESLRYSKKNHYTNQSLVIEANSKPIHVLVCLFYVYWRHLHICVYIFAATATLILNSDRRSSG